MKRNRDDGLQSLEAVFDALKSSLKCGRPPSNFKDIKNVNVYEANEDKGDDWKALLKDQAVAWIITPLRSAFPGSKNICRKASGGGTWSNKEKCENASWLVRKYIYVESTKEEQATNDGTGLRNYTMLEYLPQEDKEPQYALCRISAVNKKSDHDRPPSNSQQPKIMKIDHTDNNNIGDKGETSLSHKSMQQGGHSGNATGYCKGTVIDPEMLLAKFAEELKKIKGPISKDDVVQLLKDFYRKMVEVWNLKNTMEAGTSTQGEEQVKVQIMKGEKSSHHSSYIDATYDPREENTLEALVKSCGTLVETGDRLDQQNVQDPCNFNANPIEQTKKWDCLVNNHNINGMGANPSYCARTVPPSTDQVCEPNANVQENLSPDFTANSTGKYHGNSDAGDVTWPSTEIEGILSDWDSYSKYLYL